MRNRQFTGGKYGSEIHTQNMTPLIDRHVSEQTDIWDPGIVD